MMGGGEDEENGHKSDMVHTRLLTLSLCVHVHDCVRVQQVVCRLNGVFM